LKKFMDKLKKFADAGRDAMSYNPRY